MVGLPAGFKAQFVVTVIAGAPAVGPVPGTSVKLTAAALTVTEMDCWITAFSVTLVMLERLCPGDMRGAIIRRLRKATAIPPFRTACIMRFIGFSFSNAIPI